MQTIEAAVHRWDAENVTGMAQPVDADLAADAVEQNFTIMVPFRRFQKQAPPGSGERFRFRQTDGPGDWTVQFDGDDVRLTESTGSSDVTVAGTASDLMLFLWHRIPADQLAEAAEIAVHSTATSPSFRPHEPWNPRADRPARRRDTPVPRI